MSPTKPPIIAIIGGGISGPTLALSLKKHHGITSTIYELQSDGDERGVNIALAPNAVRVLQHLGIYHEVYEDGFSYEELTVSNARSQCLATMMQGSKERYNFPCLRTHRAKVQKALLRELNKQGITVNFEKRLVSLEERGLFVDMIFEDGSKATANFVIGADGVHSRVRDLIMDVNMDYPGFMGVIGMAVPKKMLHKSVDDVKLPNFIFGKTGFVAIMPSNYDGTEVDFFSTMPYPVQTREEWAKMNEDKTTLQSIIKERFGKDWPEYVTRLVHDFDNQGLQLFPFYEVPPLDTWMSKSGRVILAGDSAHAFTPQAGQGAAVGLEDAETLAFTISRDGFIENHMHFLKIWEAHRKNRLVDVKKLTDLNGRLRSPDTPIVQYAKEWAIWGNFKRTGPYGGLEWLFNYSSENILSLF